MTQDRSPVPQELKDSVAIVTGASSGIGRAYARALDRRGVRQILVGRSLERLAVVGESLALPPILVEGDVADASTSARAVQQALESFGRLDIVLPNAGLYLAEPGWTVDPARVQEVVTTNVLGVIHLVHAALAHFHTTGAGDIVVTSSVSGHQAISWEPVYSSTKHAIKGFVHATRQQIIGSGIRLGAVAPGVVLNELWGVHHQDQDVEDEVAAGRGMWSEDVADAVLFMLTRPRHVTIRDLVMLPTAQPI